MRFVAYGGCEGANDAHRALVERMVKLQPELVIHTGGGLVGGGRQGRDWQAFAAVTQPLRALCSYYPCRVPADGQLHLSGIDFPEAVGRGRSYYSFDHRGVHFILLDSSQRPGQDGVQMKWLLSDLAEARGRMTFVAFSDPIQTVADRRTRFGPHHPLHGLFVRHKVRAVLSGGHHIYYRTVQNGVPYIVTGGGGAPFDGIKDRRNLLPGDAVGTFHHFVEFTVKGQEIRGRAIDTEGTVRDEFVLTPP